MSRVLVLRSLSVFKLSHLWEPRILPFLMKRQYKSSSQSFSGPTSGTSGERGGEKSPQSVPSPKIDNYWNDVCTFDHEPGFFLFGSKAKGYDPNEVVKDTSFVRRLISETISSENKGDLLPNVIARNCCELYEYLNNANKKRFLNILGRHFDIPRESSINASQQYMHETKQMKDATIALFRAEQILRHALTPPYGKFFDRIVKLPSGIKILVDLRADLERFSKEDPSNVYLPELSQTLKEKLQYWLIGSLNLERITWNSSAATLEKIRKYERVHAVTDWQDLKRRVGPGRRCYGFFHRSIPHEPLVFIQVALVNGISDSIQSILHSNKQPHQHNPYAKADSAIFYSITTQKGLSGVELGSFLIKRVVSELQHELSHVETFCTLSPIPGFRRWLEENLDSSKTLLLPDELYNLKSIGVADVSDTAQLYQRILRASDWSKSPVLADAVKNPLLRWCAQYIMHEKRSDLAIDPVANFHLRNGACMHRINWLGDVSDKGMKQSFGLMANYNYVLDSIESNNREYLRSGSIAVSSDDLELLGSKRTIVDT